MDPQIVIDIMQDAFRTALFLAMPSLTFALVVGVAVSVFQSVTSIQEQTLIFVPKILAVMLALILSCAWMQSMLFRFTRQLFASIPDYIG